MKVVVNARFLTQRITGVQRFAIEVGLELKKMLGDDILFVSPSNIEQKEYAKQLSVKVVGNHKGHLWEQWDLPQYLKKQGSPLLLSLCNTAPLNYANKIVTVHDVAFEAYPQTFSKAFLYSYRFLIPRIINSAKRVIFKKEREDVSLFIIGDLSNSNFKAIDIEAYKKDPRISFLGRVSDEELVKYYSNAQAFVFPSIYEGFGLPPLEAQTCGCPVLVSDIPPHHEVVGESGKFCNPNNPNNIALGMCEILNESEILRNKGFENITRFSFEKSACQIYNIIADCLK